VTPRPRFCPGERTLDTYCTGGWVGPRSGVDSEVKEKILSSLPGIEHRSPSRSAHSQALYLLSYPASPFNLLTSLILIMVISVRLVLGGQSIKLVACFRGRTIHRYHCVGLCSLYTLTCSYTSCLDQSPAADLMVTTKDGS
jgi:hypothetical protein